MSVSVRLANRIDLPDRGGRLVVVDDHWIGLFQDNDEIFAVDAMCPHAGANLAKGQVADGAVLCPVHLWRFRLCDGVYLDQNCPQFNLRTYCVELTSTGDIFVELDQQPATTRLI